MGRFLNLELSRTSQGFVMYNQLYILAGKHFMNAETCKKQILMAA
jgi:hypothetical protein